MQEYSLENLPVGGRQMVRCDPSDDGQWVSADDAQAAIAALEARPSLAEYLKLRREYAAMETQKIVDVGRAIYLSDEIERMEREAAGEG